MTNMKTPSDRFAGLTWNDLEDWSGSKIVSRGKSYQRQRLVSGLAKTADGSLIAWVEGTKRYTAKVGWDENGQLSSICTCPYQFDCKHGVAMVIEYLDHHKNNRQVPEVRQDDDRLRLLEGSDLDDELDDDWDDDERVMSEETQKEIDIFLSGKTKGQLIQLIHELSKQYPEIARDISDRKQMTSGNTNILVTRLLREIREIGDEPGWQDYWREEGFTPDYSGIRGKLEALLKAGYADEVLTLGKELVTTGIHLVEMSHDEGETAMEIAGCMPVIVEALDRSSLDPADKLNWALDTLLKDQFEVCGEFADYLNRRHPESAWHALADRLLADLKGLERAEDEDDFGRDYTRDRLSDWAIHALEEAGRTDEIIPLCEVEAKETNSYVRLVKRLIMARRYKDAERWIQKGLRALKGRWPGIGGTLREQLREVRALEGNWPAVAAIQVEEFVRSPSRETFADCKKACGKIKAWPKVRRHLLDYLETGELPWKQEDWPLPGTCLDTPKAERRDRFPMMDKLIGIAVLERKPDQVLHWYNQLLEKGSRRHGVNEDEVAESIQTHAPNRAVDIWKNIARQLIAEVKPKAYQAAARYLRKAARVMARLKKQSEWERYLETLRKEHYRKRRLLEILDSLEGTPIIGKK